MRPLKLELEGFSAFRERVEVDFAEADLFVLTGPTGSGKSSLIDAMTFALYGSVPRYDDKRKVGDAITQGALEARVRFDFTVGEKAYTAVRVVRRMKSGVASTKEARLESNGTTLAGNADEVTQEIEKLLGLSFEQFTRCVVLPQGDFAEFLHDSPADRQKLLRRLLGVEIYQDLHSRASQRASLAEQNASLIERQLAGLAHADEASRKAAARRVGDLEKLLDRVEKALPEIDAFTSELRERKASRKTLVAEAEQLHAVRVPDGAQDLADRADAARKAAEKALALLEKTDQALDAAREATRKLGSRDALKEHKRDREALVAESAALLEAASSAEKNAKGIAKAEKETARANEEVESATRTLEEARQAHIASHLGKTLEAGKPCPVCLQPVAKIPKHKAPPAEKELTAKLEAAKAAHRDAQAEESKHHAAAAVAASNVKRLKETVATLEKRLAKAPSAEAIDASLEALERAAKAEAGAEKAARDARKSAEEARRALERETAAAKAAWKSFDAARDRLAALTPPPADREDLLASWQAFTAWAEKTAALHHKAIQGSEAAEKKIEAQRREAFQALSVLGEKLGITLVEDSPRDRAVDALAEARRALRRVEEDLERSAALREESDKAKKEQRVAALLAKHLKADGFERWVMAEALDRLVADAGGILREISGGQYDLACDDRNNFEVIDHRNADERRSVKTLSGGETFLASLALALTLVEHVASLSSAGSTRLESLFLDEGFGSLDAHTLDVVAATIESLAAGDRMIGIVTHVGDLAERIPVRFHVSKGPRTAVVERMAS